MQRLYRTLIIVFISLVILSLSGFFISKRINKPPLEKFSMVRKSIAQAKKEMASVYAPKEFHLATSLYDSAMVHWKIQNERWILLRSYEMVSVFLDKSKVQADKAIAYSGIDRKNLKGNLQRLLKNLRKQIEEFQPVFNILPVPGYIVQKNTQGQLLLSEAESAFSHGRYPESKDLLKKSGRLINDAYTFANNMLEEYFTMLPQWQADAQKMIRESKSSGKGLILIDKFNRECHCYKGGTLVNTFDAELGKNWLGDKQFQGDYATPEGLYKIIAKKEGSRTKYGKALLLNYPNEQDKQRFKEAKESGRIKKNARIGNLIEIHGDGGKGTDWTQGCIALDNKDMEWLYRKTETGTLVLIVGSLKKLSDTPYGQKYFNEAVAEK